MAATWNLPVLYLIENNRYGMGTDIRRTTNIEKLNQIALAFDMDHGEVDGMNVLKVHEKVGEVIENIRKTNRPYLLEAMTYRYKGHSVSDPGLYRSKEEVKEYQAKDPLIQLGDELKKKKLATDDDLKSWQKEAREKAKAAEIEAESGAYPDVSEVDRYIFAES
jgi:pyruvate dehydrogenase E1 component alpha subunit